MELLSQGIGNWIGISEVYDGQGQFIGNASDQRTVTKNEDDTYTVHVNILGPLMVNREYQIRIASDHHIYLGSTHFGYAEQINNDLLTTNSYWSQWGLSETSFVHVSPDTYSQLSLSLLKRGDQIIYTLVGEYHNNDKQIKYPNTIGIPIDRNDNPAAGYSSHILHRSGTWSGELTVIDENLSPMGRAYYTENVRAHQEQLMITTEGGGFTPMKRSFRMTTNGWQAWSDPGDVVGSYNMLGGRALAGSMHYIGAERRIWRREVATVDGRYKAVLHYIYQGDKRVGVQYGMLEFTKT